MQPLKLYRYPLSGHSHRAQLMLSLLALPCELIDVDLKAKAHKAPAFLELNPFGQVPVLVDGDVVVADSTAILVYLAKRYGHGRWLPEDAVAAARVQRWLSAASGPIAQHVAAARLVTVFGANFDAEQLIARSHQFLPVLERALTGTSFLVDGAPTIADVALYTYVAHAPEGNISISEYPHIRAWLTNIEQLPGFIPMQPSAVGLRAAGA